MTFPQRTHCLPKPDIGVSTCKACMHAAMLQQVLPSNTPGTQTLQREPGKSVYFFCLIFVVVCAFRVLLFLLFGRRRVLSFAAWAGARAPPKEQKKKHAHRELDAWTRTTH